MTTKQKSNDQANPINSGLPTKSYFRLSEAGALLGCSEDSLVHFGARGALQLLVPVPSDRFVVVQNRVTGELDIEFDSPDLLVIPRRDCITIDLVGKVSINDFDVGYSVWDSPPKRLLPCNPSDPKDSSRWTFRVAIKDRLMTDNLRDLCAGPSDLIILAPALHSFQSGVRGQKEDDANEQERRWPSISINQPEKLVHLNNAFRKFWQNADRDDRGTHPINAEIAAWLVANGFSKKLADSAATIIRPKWAPTGRKPEE